MLPAITNIVAKIILKWIKEHLNGWIDHSGSSCTDHTTNLGMILEYTSALYHISHVLDRGKISEEFGVQSAVGQGCNFFYR